MYVYFDVPGGFFEFPSGMSVEETRAHVAALDPHPVDEEGFLHQRPLNEVHRVSEALHELGTVYAGATLRLVDAELSMASILVTAQAFPYGDDPAVAAEGAMQSLVALRGDWSGRVYDLPTGPATVVTGNRRYRLPADVVSEKTPDHIDFAELQAFLPVPSFPSVTDRTPSDDQRLLTVTFSTSVPRHWHAYMPPVVTMLRSITFSERPEQSRGGTGAESVAPTR
ncbi:hypothetical protein SAMN06297387_12916 [Streptomyces zhaozhouensis]|uniref:Uncharacterized protein n=1 Tax=Streptomyces zhaozhouensis TaxID=1300267 RepID=A0A286E8C9_9ACTN|nr:hypothetical protein [Streptomyces zhaozhouensis]SOD67175.1 hypothetical protein SAMN06297387_12916 [Streptomyces zhaozhouensis]